MRFEEWWNTKKSEGYFRECSKGSDMWDRLAEAWNAAVVSCAEMCESVGDEWADIYPRSSLVAGPANGADDCAERLRATMVQKL